MLSGLPRAVWSDTLVKGVVGCRVCVVELVSSEWLRYRVCGLEVMLREWLSVFTYYFKEQQGQLSVR